MHHYKSLTKRDRNFSQNYVLHKVWKIILKINIIYTQNLQSGKTKQLKNFITIIIRATGISYPQSSKGQNKSVLVNVLRKTLKMGYFLYYFLK